MPTIDTPDQHELRRTASEASVIGQCDACAPLSCDEPLTLAAWLHITDRCNLRCSYCYLPHHPADMALETGYAAIDAVFRSAASYGYRQVRLKYAGGEPLLQFPTIAAMQRHARTQSGQHGFALDGVVISNGTLLTAPIIETMQSLGLRLTISLDGLGPTHDCQRPYAGGRGSSAAVIAAIELALACGLVPAISITVSNRSAPGLADLLAWVIDHALPFSLNFYRENDYAARQQDLRLEEQKIIAGMQAAYRVIEERLPLHRRPAGLLDRLDTSLPHLRPCSAGHSYLVFDPAGQVFLCQMAMQQPVATVHDADPLALVRASSAGLQNPSVEEKEGCRACALRQSCAGGCPLDAYRASGRYDSPSPYCSIYRALYPAALHLEDRCFAAASSPTHTSTMPPSRVIEPEDEQVQLTSA